MPIRFVCFAFLALAGCYSPPKADTPRVYGLPYGLTAIDREKVTAYKLYNGALSATVIDFGATLTELNVPDRHGTPGNIVLGFDGLANGYDKNAPCFGATIGRFANRIGGAQFDLDGQTVKLKPNDGGNILHGGPVGFHRRLWRGEAIATKDGPSVRLTLVSDDRDQGFPGRLTATVTYTLLREALRIDYTATTDQPTVVNLTNHSYFNLTAAPADHTIEGHVLTIDADQFTPTNPAGIPNGEFADVTGTPFDFRTPIPIGDRLPKVRGGFDHNYVLTGGVTPTPRRVATLADPETGRTMDVLTTEPGLQFYSGNFQNGLAGRGGVRYPKHAGLCLEPQHFPDSPNRPSFPSTTLRPGETFRSATVYRFDTPRER